MSCTHSHHGACINDAVAFAEAHCTAKGLRFTDLRRKVFQLIWGNHKALTASDIMAVLGKDQPPLTYRALEFLKEQKLVHYIASLNAYVGCTHPQDNHVSQMLVCTHCRDVTEVAAPDVATRLNTIAQQSGFQSHQTFIEVLGVCRGCVNVAGAT